MPVYTKLSKKRKSVLDVKTNQNKNRPTRSSERLYSVSQICILKKLPQATVLKLFSHQPDVLVLLLIPESVAIRVFKEYDEEFESSRPSPAQSNQQEETNQQEELYPVLFPICAKRGWMP